METPACLNAKSCRYLSCPEMRSPTRRRSRSETAGCRPRKCREMKIKAAASRCNPAHGGCDCNCENMVVVKNNNWTVTTTGQTGRRNLCELPTSYIANCQSDKLVNFADEVSNKVIGARRRPDNHWLCCKECCCCCCCPADFDMHDKMRERCYDDTSTYFDDVQRPGLHDKYQTEIKYLRERLLTLRNEPPAVVGADHSPEEGKRFINIMMEKYGEQPQKRQATLPPIRLSSSKVTLKTRGCKFSGAGNKLRRMSRSKLTSSTSGPTLAAAAVTAESNHYQSEEESDLEVEEVADGGEQERAKEGNNCKRIPKSGAGDASQSQWPLRQSLFPNIPPYIKFQAHDSDSLNKFPFGAKLLKWKLTTITPILVRQTLTNSGFALVRKSNQWLGTWGKHMKSPLFRTLKETQKINHFPGTFQLGRKDRLWRNIQKLINKFGHKEFGFIPHTYVLPQELKLLKQNWDQSQRDGEAMWIIKPPASARGVGIKVINRWGQLPKKTQLVVQKYVSDPYLINGSKFDLRLYVLVTSFHPLRIYLYPEGLARFASAKYDAKDLKDRYRHLTNYSINKLSDEYTANEDANACQGHKWTITKLFDHLRDSGAVPDSRRLWASLEDLVIKTMISAEPPITQLCEENTNSLYSCYELFGVDVLLDRDLKPWLLEVNISPSLHSASPLDAHVKGPLVHTLLDMAQFHLPGRLAKYAAAAGGGQAPPPCFLGKLYTTGQTKSERLKHCAFQQYEQRSDYLDDILSNLTGDDVRQLTKAEDEYAARGAFCRIFPTADTHRYLHFMEPRYYNRLFDAWETRYARNRQRGIELLRNLCELKVHLKTAAAPKLKSLQSTMPGDAPQPPPQLPSVAATAVSPPTKTTTSAQRPLEEMLRTTTLAASGPVCAAN